MRATLSIDLDPDAVDDLLAALPAALAGDEAAARRYARAWHALVREVVERDPQAPPATTTVLDHVALTAPFAPGGPVAALLSAAAGIIEGMDAPVSVATRSAAPGATLPDPLSYQRFERVVLQELSGAGTGLEPWMATWQLSVSDVARLFGVSRQAVQQWLQDGVPPARQPKLAVILRIADLLERNLQPGRVPAVVRTPADAYEGRTILQVIARDAQDQVLASVARSFDWAATA
ncbi:MAG: helix-turn-helix domain-containing protein [Actinomycetota bacterium]